MTEQEYIIVENKTKLGDAIIILRDALVGDDFGIDPELFSNTVCNLEEMYTALHGIIEIDEQDG